MNTPCQHLQRESGVCTVCGDCIHEVVLNAACLECGSVDLDPIKMSPKPPELISPTLLVRPKKS